MTNRECRNCVFPCTGGEVLHLKRLGMACSKPFCPCMKFDPVPPYRGYGPPEFRFKRSSMRPEGMRA